jgi:hypothetical protein
MVRRFLISKLEELLRLAKFLPSCGQLDHACAPTRVRAACSNLFGCGDEKGIGILREDIKERAFNNRASDRLLDNCQFVLDGHNRQCVGRTLIHLRVSALSHPPTTRRQGNKMA